MEKSLGPYVIERILGQGAQGAVLLGRHEELGRLTAIKVLLREAAEDPEMLARFRREADAASRLSHPSLTKIFELDRAGDLIYMAMEYIDGETLRDLLVRETRLPLARVLALGRELLEGLAVCHAAGVVHRDLKPVNLMVDRAGRLRILDFGLASREDRTVITRTGALVGTPRYLPPEMLLGDRVDARADLWQVGLILVECLTGKPAFPENDFQLLYQRIAKGPPAERPPLSGPDGERLTRLLDGCLQTDPDARFADATRALGVWTEAPRKRSAARPAPAVVARPAARAPALAAALAVVAAALSLAARAPVPAPAPSPSTSATASAAPARPTTAALDLAGLALSTTIKTLKDLPDLRDIRGQYHMSGTTAEQAAFRQRWKQRVDQYLVRGPLPEAIARWMALAPTLEDLERMNLETRASLTLRVHDIMDLCGTIDLAVDARATAVLAPLRVPGLLPVAAPGVPLEPYAHLVFADTRRDTSTAVVVEPPHVFNSIDSNVMLDGGVWRRRYVHQLEGPKPPFRRAWLHFRVQGGAPGQRVNLNLKPAGAPVTASLIALCIRPRHDAASQEGWLPIDARHLPPGLLELKVAGSGKALIGSTGVTVGFLEIQLER